MLIAGGLIIAQNNRTQSAASNGFFFVRPLSTQDLASARILIVLRSVGVGIAILLLVSAFTLWDIAVGGGAVMVFVACIFCAAFAFSFIWWGNIAAFGGDPERVTLLGQSSGGTNIFALLAAPSAVGLFSRAISLR